MKHLFLFFLITFSLSSNAQFTHGIIGIDGLTCSMCSNSVEKSLKQLNFVGEISMDLNENVAYVKFIDGKEVNIDQLAQKVRDSGFSVRFLKAGFLFKNFPAKNHSHYEYEGKKYIFLNIKDVVLDGEVMITFVNKQFVSKKYYSWGRVIKEDQKINPADKKNRYITL